MRWLVATPPSVAGLILRLGLAVVFFPHGAQKVLGWWGGNGFDQTMTHFTEQMGLPYSVALLVVIAEFAGPIALVFGFLTRIAALGIACVMAGAAYMVHWQHGFFMNWQGQQAGEGFEYHILAFTIAFALVCHGAGALSLDRALARPKHD